MSECGFKHHCPTRDCSPTCDDYIKEGEATTCPECGELGPHWVVVDNPFLGLGDGFWTCAKFYGPDGKRIL